MNKKCIALIIAALPLASFAKGINVTKDQFVSAFCNYLTSPDVTTESKICPVNVEYVDNNDHSQGYKIDVPNGSVVKFSTDDKDNKVASVIFNHSLDVAGSDDVTQIRYAIINAVDSGLYKKHGEDFYNLISARKAMRAGNKIPAEHNSLSHNGIDYQYTFVNLDDSYSFQVHNH